MENSPSLFLALTLGHFHFYENDPLVSFVVDIKTKVLSTHFLEQNPQKKFG